MNIILLAIGAMLLTTGALKPKKGKAKARHKKKFQKAVKGDLTVLVPLLKELKTLRMAVISKMQQTDNPELYAKYRGEKNSIEARIKKLEQVSQKYNV